MPYISCQYCEREIGCAGELKARLAESEELRSALVVASVDMARDMATMITQLQEWSAVVRAASAFVQDPFSVNALFALDEAVSALTRPA